MALDIIQKTMNRSEVLWTPRFIDTLCWYDSSRLDLITKDGSDFVSQLDDVKGQASPLANPFGASQPQWFDSLFFARNSPGLYFDDLGDWLSTDDCGTELGDQDLAVFALFTLDTTEPNAGSLFQVGTGTYDEALTEEQRNASHVYFSSVGKGGIATDILVHNQAKYTADPPIFPGGGSPYRSPSIDSYVKAAGTPALNAALYHNGSPTSLGIGNTENLDLLDTKLRLGSTQLSHPTDPFLVTPSASFAFHEMVLTNDISTENRQRVEGYLAYKWGMTIYLDAGHPYKNNPPLN